MSDRIYYSRDAEVAARRQNTVSALAFLILGVAIGASVSMLFAPRGGDETRNQIAEAIDEGIHRGHQAVNDALQQLGADRPDLRAEVERVLNNIRS